jgi:hypothetical protein
MCASYCALPLQPESVLYRLIGLPSASDTGNPCYDHGELRLDPWARSVATQMGDRLEEKNNNLALLNISRSDIPFRVSVQACGPP